MEIDDESSTPDFIDLTDTSIAQSNNMTATSLTRGETTALVAGKFAVQPIARPPFPQKVRDRSPIIGVSSDMLLRTCFRTGEALNVGSQAVRMGHTVFIELYARVSSGYKRNEGKGMRRWDVDYNGRAGS